MKKLMTRLANLFAKFSVRRWNRFRPLRVLCRFAYQAMNKVYIYFNHTIYDYDPARFIPKLNSYSLRDTYPWPYSASAFANWPEDDTPEAYTLIADHLGFVIRHSPSYCAWKIKELTGHWPKRRYPDTSRHAKNWQALLAANGYTEIIDSPAHDIFQNCIGIDRDYGEFGQLYWYESPHFSEIEASPIACTGFNCSTYLDGAYQCVLISLEAAKKLTWVVID